MISHVALSSILCVLIQFHLFSARFFSPLCVRMKKVLISQAEAEKIRKIGEAEASSIEAVGKAEAEKMRLKAEAYQQYGDAAKTALVLEALPKVMHGYRVPVSIKQTVAHSSCYILFYNSLLIIVNI